MSPSPFVVSARERRGPAQRRNRIVPAELPGRRGGRPADRRAEDRRDSPRREVALDVREPGLKSRSCQGDLSVEGASFITSTPPAGDVVLLRFTVPTWTGDIVARAKVVAREGAMLGTQISVTFTELDVEAQLAIAEWFDFGAA